jgi:hypothetical protein
MHHKALMLLAFLVVLCLCLLGCSSKESSEPIAKASSGPRPSPQSSALTERDDSESNTEDSDESKAKEASDNSNEEESDAEYFHGHRCTVDCSGHEAGYDWAEEHDIHDPDDCGGNSQSFIEGCQTYAEENPEEAPEEEPN